MNKPLKSAIETVEKSQEVNDEAEKAVISEAKADTVAMGNDIENGKEGAAPEGAPEIKQSEKSVDAKADEEVKKDEDGEDVVASVKEEAKEEDQATKAVAYEDFLTLSKSIQDTNELTSSVSKTLDAMPEAIAKSLGDIIKSSINDVVEKAMAEKAVISEKNHKDLSQSEKAVISEKNKTDLEHSEKAVEEDEAEAEKACAPKAEKDIDASQDQSQKAVISEKNHKDLSQSEKSVDEDCEDDEECDDKKEAKKSVDNSQPVEKSVTVKEVTNEPTAKAIVAEPEEDKEVITKSVEQPVVKSADEIKKAAWDLMEAIPNIKLAKSLSNTEMASLNHAFNLAKSAYRSASEAPLNDANALYKELSN